MLTRLQLYKIFKDYDIAHVVVMLARERAQLSSKLRIHLDDYGAIFAKSLSSGSMDETVASLNQFGAMMEARGATAARVSTL